MNKTIYIAAVLGMTLALASCQKTEFEDIIVPASSNSEEAKVTDVEVISISDPVNITAEDEVVLDNPNVSGMVKEVSDGDEESDDDENVSSN